MGISIHETGSKDKNRGSEWPGNSWTMLEAALFYAELGWRVLPVSQDKRALIKKWQHEATTNRTTIKNWFMQFPDANVAVVCGAASGVAVIDIDVKDGKKGLENAEGLGLADYASCLKARTPSGGQHLFYAHHELPFRSNVGIAANDIDLRSSDMAAVDNGSGYVLLAPSIGPGGKRYSWTGTDISDLQTDPDGSIIPAEIALAFCFNAKERLVIDSTEGLRAALLGMPRRNWADEYNAARTFSTGGLMRLPAGASARNDLDLDTPYVKKALDAELDRISSARKDQNETLSSASACIGTLLAGIGIEAGSANALAVREDIVKAALCMTSTNSSAPWTGTKGRRAIDATVDGQLGWGLRNPRDLSHVTPMHSGEGGSPSVCGVEPAPLYAPEMATDLALKNTRKAQLTSMANVVAKQVEWLWPMRIPKGALSIIAGDPSQGKSQITCYMAAVVSTGRPWCDGDNKHSRDAQDVILLNAEDAADAVIKPRLLAAEANVQKVFTIKSVIKRDHKGEATETDMSLAQDILGLDNALAENGNVGLVVIDPISAYLGRVDSHNNSEVRGILAPLARLAEKHKVAMVCVSHLNKGSGGKVTDRVTGSLAFSAAARAVYLVGADPDDNADDDAKMFVAGKTNLAPNTQGLSFKIESHLVVADGVPINTSRVAWGASISASVDDMLRGKDDKHDGRKEGREKLNTWLSKFLADGHWRTFETIEEAAKKAGHDKSKRTFERAAEDIGVVKERCGVGESGSKWHLPKRH